MTSLEAIDLVESATGYAHLFAGVPHKRYRELAKLVHPDRVEVSLRGRAEKAFSKLAQLYREKAGGETGAPATRVGEWDILKPLAKGGISDLYLARRKSLDAVLRIVRSEADNALLAREATSLAALHGDKRSDAFKKYIPRVLDTFVASDRQVNVLSYAQDCLPLTYIRFSAAKGGVPFQHVVWMMNRLLEVLGFAHENGVIHGAILPNHLLYRPEDHGLILIDWASSVQFPSADGHIPLRIARWRDHYPVEVGKRNAYSATDIFMAAKAMQFAAASMPARFRGILDWCLAESPASRPNSAWELQDRWKTLAVEEYGKPTFVKLDIPVH